MAQTLAFADWRPDQPALADVLSVADNVLPGPNGYRPVPAFVALPGSALPGYPLGARSFVAPSRLTSTFAGTATTLYLYSAAGWDAIGTGFAASDDNPWQFQQFGQWVIASNGADLPQYYDLTASTAFLPLPGNPPQMKLLGVIGSFLVGGVVNGAALTVRWSGINSAVRWTVGVAQSDEQTFPDGGDVVGLVGWNEGGLVLQSEAIRRMDYVGGDLIFSFSVVSSNVGCTHPRAWAQVGRSVFFHSPRGFMMYDGATVVPIGDERVDATFSAAMDRGFLARMSCVADPVRKVVYWSVPAAEPSVWFAYHWGLQRWSRVVQPARLLASGRSRDISLDEDYGSPDTLFDTGLSFDDPAYLGGAPAFNVFNGSNVLGTMSGAPAAAALATPLVEPSPGLCLRTSRLRPLSDAVAGLTLTLDARPRVGDAAAASTHTELTVEGDMPALRRGRYMSARLDIAAGTAWTFASGVAVTGRAEGGLR